MRSGREHWAWMVVVEVRRGTLGAGGRGCGPADDEEERGKEEKEKKKEEIGLT